MWIKAAPDVEMKMEEEDSTEEGAKKPSDNENEQQEDAVQIDGKAAAGKYCHVHKCI